MARPLVAALLALAMAAGCSGVPGSERQHLALVLRPVPDPDHAGFVDELRTQRFGVGRNLTLVPTDDDVVHPDAAAAVAAMTAQEPSPDVVVAYSTPLARAAVDTLPDVPVIVVVNDPVASDLVDDRSRPGGRVTGVSLAIPADRTLELTRRLLGGLDRLGYLAPEDDAAVDGHRSAVLAAAAAAGVEVVEATYADDAAVQGAVDELVAADVDAALLANATATFAAHDALRTASAAAELAVVSNDARADFAVLVFEPDGATLRRQVARQVARVLDGDPLAQIPVEDPRRFRVVIDDDRAAALGIEQVEAGLLRQADDVR